MAVNAKIIKRRIKSVANTKKITKAMELVAASKMRKAVASVLSSRPYATLAWSLVDQLTAKSAGNEPHALVSPRAEVKKTLAVLFTSDRGLCGGFNAQVLRVAADVLSKRPAGSVEFITVGKRGEAWLRRRDITVVASFPDLLQTPTAASIRPLAKLMTEQFTKRQCDEALVLYNDYVSAILQKPRAKTLLPLRKDSELGAVSPAQAGAQTVVDDSGSLPSQGKQVREYLFEPNPQSVLDALLPRILESQIYQATLESIASEHAARMLAMRNATDSAKEMLDDLNFTYNQARQAGITREIAEISAGTAAIAG